MICQCLHSGCKCLIIVTAIAPVCVGCSLDMHDSPKPAPITRALQWEMAPNGLAMKKAQP